ncbi:DUF6603 domain-containing protein [Micromonosporaceae bacterium Da 78-11]
MTGGFSVAVTGLRLVVGAAPGDGFLGALLPPDGLTVELDLGLTWTPEGGVQLSGSAALDLVLALGLELGPITLDAAQLGVRLGDHGLALLATVSGTLHLGPVTAVVERIGPQATLGPSDSGNAALAVGFKPPAGLGLVVSAGPVARTAARPRRGRPARGRPHRRDHPGPRRARQPRPADRGTLGRSARRRPRPVRRGHPPAGAGAGRRRRLRLAARRRTPDVVAPAAARRGPDAHPARADRAHPPLGARR